MRRRVLNLLAVLSLLLCVCSVAAWASGRRHVTRVSGSVFHAEWSAAAARGKLYCFFSPDPGRIYRRAYVTHPFGMRVVFDQPPSRVSARQECDVLPDRRRNVRRWALGVTTLRGECGPCVIDVEDRSARPPRWKSFVAAATPAPDRAHYGPAFGRYRRYFVAAVPIWPMTCLFALPPAAGALRLLRARRLATAGHCRACGYDVRATPDRCPECGTAAGPSPDPVGSRPAPVMP